MTDELSRLRAENERLTGENATLGAQVDSLTAKLADATEVWFDEATEVTWSVPTAWAYAQACKAINKHREVTDTATRDLRKYARHLDGCAANLSKAGLYGHACTCGFAALADDPHPADKETRR